MNPYAALLKQQSDLQSQRQALKADLSSVAAQIALYDTARTLRPAGVDPTWEPLLDPSGVLRGWIDPAYAAPFYK